MRSIGVYVLYQKGFDEEKEVQVHEEGLKTLIRINDERELQELFRYLKHFVVSLSLFFLLGIYFIEAV